MVKGIKIMNETSTDIYHWQIGSHFYSIVEDNGSWHLYKMGK